MSATTTTAQAEAAFAAYTAAYDRLRDLGSLDCELANLKTQQENGNPRPWVREATAKHGQITQARLDQVKAERQAASEEARRLSTVAYRALLEAGLAFDVLDHSARLKTRPYEVRRASLLESGGFIAAHGASLHLARYASREAAEKTIAKTTAAELARLDEEAGA